MQQLYAFGFNGHAQFTGIGVAAAADSSSNSSSSSISASDASVIATPRPVIRAESIKILWASWCDALIVTQHGSEHGARVRYSGKGLSDQHAHVLNQGKTAGGLPFVRADEDEHGRQHARSAMALRGSKCFGGALDIGLGGIIIAPRPGQEVDNDVTLFVSGQDCGGSDAAGDMENYRIINNDGAQVVDVSVGAGGVVLVGVQTHSQLHGMIVRFESLKDLRGRLSDKDKGITEMPCNIVANFAPSQLCANATTWTALDHSGKVYTYSRDHRFPKCLGRPSTGSDHFQLVPYLEEVTNVKIASGGYMTAAISDDRELFVWGQACPGTEDELYFLKESETTEPGQAEHSRDITYRSQGSTKAFGENENERMVAPELNIEEQDEFVKCVHLTFDGGNARASDVAIGHGHILVAVEGKERTLLAAGENGKGQLGLSTRSRTFVNHFQEAKQFRGKQIREMRCAGWSSLVVMDG